MATQSALGSNINSLAGIASLISTLTGGGDKTVTTSGGTSTATSTKQTNISAEGLQALIQSMLEDQSTGLAKVASGSKQAGLYNASTNTLLVNDLISRAANAAALASAPTTTTETRTSTPTTQVTSAEGLLGSSSSSALLPLLGAGLLMKKDSSGKSAFDTLSGALGGFFGNDSNTSAYDLIAGGISENTMGANAISSLIDSYAQSSSNAVDAAGTAVNVLSGVDLSGAGETISGIVSGAGDVLAGVGSSVIDYADEAIDYVSDIVSGWF